MLGVQDHKPQRIPSDRLILEELPDELMIYDPDRHKAFCLNQCAAFVWKHLDGQRTVADITQLMSRQFSRPVNEQVVWLALDLLAKDGLLIPSSLPSAEMTRRTLLRKFSVGAAAVPVVTVLFVAPAKAHASGSVHREASWNRFDRRRSCEEGGILPVLRGGFKHARFIGQPFDKSKL